MTCVVAALYKFAPLPHFEELRAPLREHCREHGIVGTILLAAEGINGTVAGTREAIDALLARLRAEPVLADLEPKLSFVDTLPFHRLKVRLKREIVTIGDAQIDPTHRVGTYVDAEAWNELLADPEVIVIDTRNSYEVRIGTFEGAVDPELDSFRAFPAWADAHLDPNEHRKVAMFCTGGIRCEKASSLLLERGFTEVYHLRGGILSYLERVPKTASKWQGECFVFDNRVALDHDLAPGEHTLCFGCKEPVSPSERQSPLYESGVCCHRCHATVDEATRERRRERVRQIELAKSHGAQHLGATMPDRDAPSKREAP